MVWCHTNHPQHNLEGAGLRHRKVQTGPIKRYNSTLGGGLVYLWCSAAAGIFISPREPVQRINKVPSIYLHPHLHLLSISSPLHLILIFTFMSTLNSTSSVPHLPPLSSSSHLLPPSSLAHPNLHLHLYLLLIYISSPPSSRVISTFISTLVSTSYSPSSPPHFQLRFRLFLMMRLMMSLAQSDQ